jgi:hypothetical protein
MKSAPAPGDTEGSRDDDRETRSDDPYDSSCTLYHDVRSETNISRYILPRVDLDCYTPIMYTLCLVRQYPSIPGTSGSRYLMALPYCPIRPLHRSLVSSYL